jgi:Transglutaminase-like superfamily
MMVLTLRAYLMLLSFEAVLAKRDFSQLYRRVREQKVRRTRQAFGAGQACQAVNMACTLYFKEVQCLQRSAVLVCLLRELGMPAALVIGAQRLPFQAHAWVEFAGRTINDSDSAVELYGVLDRL